MKKRNITSNKKSKEELSKLKEELSELREALKQIPNLLNTKIEELKEKQKEK